MKNEVEIEMYQHIDLRGMASNLLMSSVRERREHWVYETLLKIIPNFEEQLMNFSEKIE
jgi:hypothetical protein